MKLLKALRADSTLQLALVGAGGKTTTIFRLARQFQGPVLVTASTHFSTQQAGFGDAHLVIEPGNRIRDRLAEPKQGVIVITGPVEPADERTKGLTDEQLEEVHRMANEWQIPLLIEADGARSRWLKAPATHEPAIPPWANTVLQVVGMSALGKPLDAEWVHRPEIFSRLTGRALGQSVTEYDIVRYLHLPEGGLKNIPAGARRLLLLNQVESAELEVAADRMADQLLDAYEEILVGAVENDDQEYAILRVATKVAGVILAGGSSERYGQPKQLLLYHGKLFIRVVAETAIAAGLSPVVVVLGAVHEPIREALAGLPVDFVDNPDWAAGQSTSLRAGILGLPSTCSGALFMLSDQPQVPVELVDRIVKRHQATFSPIVAPFVNGKRANPVLFDRSTFEKLLSLSGDTGGRALFDQLAVEKIEWSDARLALDVDTPEDYQRLLEAMQ